MSDKLTPMQERVRSLFDRFDKDVEISRIHLVARGTNSWMPGREFTPRAMQMRIAPLIRRINLKLHAGKIVPGDLKQTYRMIRVQKEQ